MCHVGTVSSRKTKNLRKNPHIAEISIPGYDPLVAHSRVGGGPGTFFSTHGNHLP